MTVRIVVGLAASLLVSGAASLDTSAPAQAASGACKDNTAVTVVVDPKGLGGGVDVDCVAGGQSATNQFIAAGHGIEKVRSQPAMVCRVDGAPADQPSNCQVAPPADAYWSLWWTDGTGGDWVYSQLGADSLKVPTGGYVAFSWNTGGDRDKPAYTPVALPSPSPTASATPTKKPTTSPTGKPSSGPTKTPSSQAASTGSATPTTTVPDGSGSASASAQGSSSSTTTASEAATPSATISDSATTADPSEPGVDSSTDSGSTSAVSSSIDTGGLPGWVPPVGIVALLVVLAAVVVMRRRALVDGDDV